MIILPIIFITGHGDIPMTVQAMKAGAVEFLTKPFRDQELLDAIQQALERDRAAREQRLGSAELRARYDSLTPREREVMGIVVAGCSTSRSPQSSGTSEINDQAASRTGHAKDAGRIRWRTWSGWPKTWNSIHKGISNPIPKYSRNPSFTVLSLTQISLKESLKNFARISIRNGGSVAEIPVISIVDDDESVREAYRKSHENRWDIMPRCFHRRRIS